MELGGQKVKDDAAAAGGGGVWGGGTRRCGVSTRPFFLLFYLKLFEKGSEKKQKQQRERENETSEGRKKTIVRLVVEKK